MFLQKIRLSIGNMLNNLKNVQPCSLSSVKLPDVKNILIFANIESQNDFDTFNAFRKNLLKLCPQAKIHALLFVDKESHQEFAGISDYDKQFFSTDDFSLFMKIQNMDIIETLKNQYNLAVNICIRPQIYIDYLFHYVRANLYVGQANEKIKNLNFMINAQAPTTEALCQNIENNLKMFF